MQEPIVISSDEDDDEDLTDHISSDDHGQTDDPNSDDDDQTDNPSGDYDDLADDPSRDDDMTDVPSSDDQEDGDDEPHATPQQPARGQNKTQKIPPWVQKFNEELQEKLAQYHLRPNLTRMEVRALSKQQKRERKLFLHKQAKMKHLKKDPEKPRELERARWNKRKQDPEARAMIRGYTNNKLLREKIRRRIDDDFHKWSVESRRM